MSRPNTKPREGIVSECNCYNYLCHIPCPNVSNCVFVCAVTSSLHIEDTSKNHPTSIICKLYIIMLSSSKIVIFFSFLFPYLRFDVSIIQKEKAWANAHQGICDTRRQIKMKWRCMHSAELNKSLRPTLLRLYYELQGPGTISEYSSALNMAEMFIFHSFIIINLCNFSGV